MAEAAKPNIDWLLDFLDNLPGIAVYRIVVEPDGRRHVEWASARLGEMFGLRLGELQQDAMALYAKAPPALLDKLSRLEEKSLRDLSPLVFEAPGVGPDGEDRWYEVQSHPTKKDDGSISWDGIIIDVTKRKAIEKRIAKLGGILYICSSCKKIRDDDGHWLQMESYIYRNSDAAFSHGFCDDCAQDFVESEFLSD